MYRKAMLRMNALNEHRSLNTLIFLVNGELNLQLMNVNISSNNKEKM